jgi:hypothetical protein
MPKQIRRKLDGKSERCIFTGYNENSKEYILYNPVIKKFTINKDVEFKEAKAWNGSVDKTMIVGEKIPYGQVDVEKHIEQVGKKYTQSQSLVKGTPKRNPRNYIQGESSRLVSQSTPGPQSSNDYGPNTRKTRTLQEIYEELDNHLIFSLFSYQPTFVEEAIKE